MDKKQAITHILTVAEDFKSILSTDISCQLINKSLYVQGLVSLDLYNHVQEEIKSKTIYNYLPYVKAYNDRQKQFKTSLTRTKMGLNPYERKPIIVQKAAPKVKGFLNYE